MLTRLKVDGFETFENFSVDLDPFTVILGNNAAAKSNLFDVVQLLSCLAERDVNEAVKRLRGEPPELFRNTPAGRAHRIDLAVEVLVDPFVKDSYGSRVELAHTRLRYELAPARPHGWSRRPEMPGRSSRSRRMASRGGSARLTRRRPPCCQASLTVRNSATCSPCASK